MPRSPSRDLADRFRGHRDYFSGKTRFERLRWWLSVVVMLAAGAWVVAKLVVRPAQSYPFATHGEVANVHALWNQQCDACHRPQSITGQTDYLDAHSRWHELTCEKCHTGALHHPNLKADFQRETCSTCHHDHNGKNYSLVKIADSHCTRCHGNVSDFQQKANQKAAQKVTNFANDHPIFKPFEKHERKLKFSHALHLTPGMPYTVAEIDTAKKGERELYSFKRAVELGHGDVAKMYGSNKSKPEDLLSLNCQSCHEPAADGKYFKPINYEQHCGACHPNEIARSVTPAGNVAPKHRVPHGKPMNDYAELLKGLFTTDLVTPSDAAVKPKMTAATPPTAPAAVEFKAQIDVLAAKGLSNLKDVACTKCHDLDKGDVVKPAIPTIWMPKARFDHYAHRAADCTACHDKDSKERVGDGDVKEIDHGYRAKNVDIQGIENCRTCHAPPGHDGQGRPVGGVAYGCVECHGYHQADKLHQRAGDAFKHHEKNSFDIYDFLRGKRKE